MKGTTSAEEVVISVGLDVHKESVSVGVAVGDQEPQLVTTMRNRPVEISKLLRRLEEKGRLQVVYEAGPCGYEIYRLCQKLDVECMVAAPSLIPHKPGERVKTDKRDAIKLARLLRSGDLTVVPRRQSRGAARSGASPRGRPGGQAADPASWSAQYRKWLAEVTFQDTNQRVVWQEYLQAVKGGLQPSLRDASSALDGLLTAALGSSYGGKLEIWYVRPRSRSVSELTRIGAMLDWSLGESGIHKGGPRPNYVIGPEVQAHALRPRQLQAASTVAIRVSRARGYQSDQPSRSLASPTDQPSVHARAAPPLPLDNRSFHIS